MFNIKQSEDSSNTHTVKHYFDPFRRYSRYHAYLMGIPDGGVVDPAFEERFNEFHVEVFSSRRHEGWARRESGFTGKLMYHHPNYNALVHRFLDQFKDIYPDVDLITRVHEREFIGRPKHDDNPAETGVRAKYDEDLKAFFHTISSGEEVAGWDRIKSTHAQHRLYWRHPQWEELYHAWMDKQGFPRHYPDQYQVYEIIPVK